jgi:dephospho-CoA kinase
MRWIGLTGSIGSGKSTVAELLVKRGFAVADADVFARAAVAPGTIGETKVLHEFGTGILDSAGRLDRKKLGDVVFGDPAKLAKLEGILHPLIREMTKARRDELAAGGHKMGFYDVPLLFEKQMEPLFDEIVVVSSDPKVCIERVMKRSSMAREDVEKRLRAQLSIEEKIKRAHWVIRNDGTREELEKAVDQFLRDVGRNLSPRH